MGDEITHLLPVCMSKNKMDFLIGGCCFPVKQSFLKAY